MRTIRIKAYKFNELSKEAKETAIDNYRSTDHYDGFYYDEISDSVNAVCDLFNLKTGRTYSDIRTDHIDDAILELSGVRLSTWLLNNYENDLFKGKYYSTNNVGSKNYKSRHSNIQLEHSCVLTGVCYDDDILEPIYKFLKYPYKNVTFADLIHDIELAISKCYSDVKTWLYSSEFISDHFETNDYEFTKEGKLI